MKSNKTRILSSLILGALAVSAITARAGLQVETDTNSLAPLTTNLFVLWGDKTGSYTNGQGPGGNQFIDGGKSQTLACLVGGFFTNTTANASNVNFVVAQTVDFAQWTNAALNITVSVPGSSSNWCGTQFFITNAYPGYGLREERNTNHDGVTGATGTCFFKALSKTGD